MAKSTGLIVTAGALSLTDLALEGWEPSQGVRIAGATIVAALVSAGLDKLIPGLGTGLGVLLLVAVLFKSGPKISDHLFPPRTGFGPA